MAPCFGRQRCHRDISGEASYDCAQIEIVHEGTGSLADAVTKFSRCAMSIGRREQCCWDSSKNSHWRATFLRTACRPRRREAHAVRIKPLTLLVAWMFHSRLCCAYEVPPRHIVIMLICHAQEVAVDQPPRFSKSVFGIIGELFLHSLSLPRHCWQ